MFAFGPHRPKPAGVRKGDHMTGHLSSTLPELPVPPYVSQWGEMACNVAVIERGEDPSALHDWRADGYLSAADYRFWSRQTCGLACLQMILASCPARWGRPPCKAALLADAVAHGVLVPQDDGSVLGLIYAPFVSWVDEAFGLEAVSMPNLPVETLLRAVSSGAWLAMASVSWEIRTPEAEPTHTGGHLVLVYDVDEGPKGPAAVFHNPSGLPESAEGVRMDARRFGRFFAGRGILVRRP